MSDLDAPNYSAAMELMTRMDPENGTTFHQTTAEWLGAMSQRELVSLLGGTAQLFYATLIRMQAGGLDSKVFLRQLVLDLQT